MLERFRRAIGYFFSPGAGAVHEWRPCQVNRQWGKVCTLCEPPHVEVMTIERYYAEFGERFGMLPVKSPNRWPR